jgi:hypothetical protein
VPLDESKLITTVAEGGAGAADSISTVYSTSALTSRPFQIIGYFKSTQTTAGTWASALTLVQGGNVTSINKASLGFNNYYQSPSQTITSAGSLTLTHGLGRKPVQFAFTLVNTTTEGNYSVGDEVVVTPTYSFNGTLNGGFALIPDATNLNIRFLNSGTTAMFLLPNKTTGVPFAITNANWGIIVRAWG